MYIDIYVFLELYMLRVIKLKSLIECMQLI